MNIYDVTLVTGYNKTEKRLNVLAKSATEASEFATRYGNKNSYNPEVTSVTKTLAVDVHYTSKAKKRK